MRVLTTSIQLVLLSITVGSSSGCYTLVDQYQQFEIGVRNRFCANRAWNRVEDRFDNLDHKRHFQNGFNAGYIAAAADSDACPPSIAPQKYWSVRFQNPDGREKVHAWFQGYSHGMIEAHQDGLHHYSEIPTMGLENPALHANAEHKVWLDGAPDDSPRSRELFPVPKPDPAPSQPPPAPPTADDKRSYDSAQRQYIRPLSGYRLPVNAPAFVEEDEQYWLQPKPLYPPGNSAGVQ